MKVCSTFINEWEDEHRDPEDSFKEVTIEALAKAFEFFFGGYVMSKSPKAELLARTQR